VAAIRISPISAGVRCVLSADEAGIIGPITEAMMSNIMLVGKTAIAY
jgi:hypothetical protein